MKRVRHWLATAIVAATLLLSGTDFASASNKSECTAGFACAFEDAHFWGLIMNRNKPGTYGFTSLTNDETSSVYNRNSHDTQYFWGAVGSSYICLRKNEELSYVGDTWNDEISIMRITSGSSTC